MIFVTGATGFIGAHFLYHLLEQGEKVFALKRPTSSLNTVKRVFQFYDSNYQEKLDNINWVEGTVESDHSLLAEAKSADVILHLAAMVSFDPRDRYRMKAVNIKGTRNMVNLALENGISKFIYISSVGALDPVRTGDRITEENFGNNPKRNSQYAETKFKSELEVWRGIEEGLKAVIVNPSVVLGPGIPVEGPGKIFNKIQKGMRYYPPGITGFVDVRDVCQATLELFYKGMFNERFIISEGNYSYMEIFEWIASEFGGKKPSGKIPESLTSLAWRMEKVRSKLFGVKPLITKEIHNSMHNQVYFANDKIRERLGYHFIAVAKSIKDTVKEMQRQK